MRRLWPRSGTTPETPAHRQGEQPPITRDAKPVKSSADSSAIRLSETAGRLLTLAGLLVAFLLRLYRLGDESLWYDETVSAFLARQPFADMVSHTALDIHPPGYYALLHAWATVTAPFGTPALEYLLAYPSLWFGLLSIALLAPIGRILLGHSPPILAVWLAAINPFQLWYAQEVRMYTVAAALGSCALLAALQFTRATAGPHAGQSHNASTVAWLALYAVAAAAGLYTLYYFAFALLAVNLAVLTTFYLLSRNRNHKHLGRGALAWVAAQAGALLLFCRVDTHLRAPGPGAPRPPLAAAVGRHRPSALRRRRRLRRLRRRAKRPQRASVVVGGPGRPALHSLVWLHEIAPVAGARSPHPLAAALSPRAAPGHLRRQRPGYTHLPRALSRRLRARLLLDRSGRSARSVPAPARRVSHSLPSPSSPAPPTAPPATGVTRTTGPTTTAPLLPCSPNNGDPATPSSPMPAGSIPPSTPTGPQASSARTTPCRPAPSRGRAWAMRQPLQH